MTALKILLLSLVLASCASYQPPGAGLTPAVCAITECKK